MPKKTSTHEQPTANRADKDLDQAIARVLRVFGPNLEAFFKAIRNQLGDERRESVEHVEHPKIPDAHVQ